MRVRTIIGAEAAYASIQTLYCNMDVRLNPGRSAAQSLRETADEWREKAARLQQRAMLLNEAAAQLEEDAKSGRKYSSREAA
jgi:hypothetical protein